MNTNNSEQVIWFIELSKYSKERLFDPLLNGRFLPFNTENQALNIIYNTYIPKGSIILKYNTNINEFIVNEKVVINIISYKLYENIIKVYVEFFHNEDSLINSILGLSFALINLKQFKSIKTLTGYIRYISIKNF